MSRLITSTSRSRKWIVQPVAYGILMNVAELGSRGRAVFRTRLRRPSGSGFRGAIPRPDFQIRRGTSIVSASGGGRKREGRDGASRGQ